MLLRFDPFAEFDRLATRPGNPDGFMAADGYRQGDAFVIHLDLPGIDNDSIDMTVENDTLTITAERKWERDESIQMVMQERKTGSFTRRFILGESLDSDGIEAGYDKGVLTVRIPVREQAKPRKISVGRSDRALTG